MLPRCPSQRDQDIFQAVAIEGRSQRQTAAEFRLSQPRITQIVQRVRAWTGDARPSQVGEQLPSGTVRAAWRTQQRRLAYLYHQALEAWRRSLEPQVTRKTVEASGATREERIARTQCGRASLLAQAQRLCEAMAAADGVDLAWRSRNSPLKRTLTPHEQTEIVTLHEILQNIERRRREEPDDEPPPAAPTAGPPGAPWSAPPSDPQAPKTVLPIDYPNTYRTWDWQADDFPPDEPPPSASEPAQASAAEEARSADEASAAEATSPSEAAAKAAPDHPLSPASADNSARRADAAATVGGASLPAESCDQPAGPKSFAAEPEIIAPSAYRGSNSSPDPYGAAAAALTDRHRRDPRIIIWER